MKYIKTFENRTRILYKNDDFRISISENNSFNYESRMNSLSAIFAMAALVCDNSKYLSDQKLRAVKIRDIDIISDLKNFELYDEKIDNIKKYHTSLINGFLDGMHNRDYIKSIPDNVYMEMTYKYYPIMAEAIEKSMTLGDVIDNFKIIYNDIVPEMKYKIELNKYNL